MIGTAVLLPGKGPEGFPLALVLATRGRDFCLELVSGGGGDPLSLSLGNSSPYSHSRSPCSCDTYLDVVTFIWVVCFVALVAGWVLGFDHQLQKIYSALRRKAGEFLWWQVPWRAQISRFHSPSIIFKLKASPKCMWLPYWKTLTLAFYFGNLSVLFVKPLGGRPVSQMNFGKGIQTLKGRILPRSSFNFWKVRGEGTTPKGGIAALVLLTLLSFILCLIFFRESLTLTYYKFCKPKLSAILLSLYLDLASDHGCIKSTCFSARTGQLGLFWLLKGSVYT